MNDIQKKEVQSILNNWTNPLPLLNISNVSETTISNIINGNWQNISEEVWHAIGAQIRYSHKSSWSIVHTQDFNLLTTIFNDSKEFANVFAVVAPAGSGKSTTSSQYEQNNHNVYHLVCAEYFNRKTFLSKLLEKLGKDGSGSVTEMMDMVVETLMKEERPIIILDEADKLTDQVLYFFITLYNMLKGKCGIVMLSTDYLSKRINRGRKLNKKGYNEIFSRIGRRFINLRGTTKEDVIAICEANGLSLPQEISAIQNDYDGDLRRVERAVHRAKLITRQSTIQN